MKIRNGFVSNSSSSSFVISKYYLSEFQIRKIKNHISYLVNDGPFSPSKEDEWGIEETEAEIKGFTTMDNFDMYAFLIEEAKVDKGFINWDKY